MNNKVAVVINSFEIGGTEVAALSFIDKLIEENNEVTLYVMGNHGPLKDRLNKKAVLKEVELTDDSYRLIADYSTVPNSNLLTQIKRKSLILKLNDKDVYKALLSKCVPVKEEYDLVCDFFGYGTFTTAYAAKVLKGKKKALWFHDEGIIFINNVDSFLNDYDKYYCVSKAVYDNLILKKPEFKDKSEILYNFIDTKRIIDKSKEFEVKLDGEFNILTIGRLSNQKGIDIAINIAAILKDKGIKFKWYEIGSGEGLNEYKELINKLNLKDYFILLGQKDNPYPYLKECDLYVQPSRHEGYGITLIEARTLNRVIVASNLKPFLEQIKDNENGFICELDSKEFADKIIYLINNPKEIERIKENLTKEVIDYSQEYLKIKKILEE